ncbi:ATP-binding protein, partial [Nonomuraea lactucae]|uniref:ATP-binding protein n=1 Tax=Nonomuraea lactucae TaxID=2249762 RepID=UPI0013B40C62
MELIGRGAEVGALIQLLACVRGGSSGVLVVHGEAGIGKTALLDFLAGAAEPDVRVIRLAGLESESGLGYAALHRLLAPFLASLDGLPAPQRQALGSAFGLVEHAPAELFLVGLAALTLLSEGAAYRPVLCVVDDAQWLDRESLDVLAFVARRLAAERVLAEAEGNPLALVELSGHLTPLQLRGTSFLPERVALSHRLEAYYQRQVAALPHRTRMFLLLAAAEPAGDPAVFWRAAELLGLSPDAGGPAETAGLLRLTPQVAFRHPLVRSSIYRGARTAARLRVETALAAATDDPKEADRRAWHLAAATVGPDEEVAAALEAAATGTGRRGGHTSRSAMLERAAELTPDPATRARRLLGAALAGLPGNAPARTMALLDEAAPQLPDPLSRA